MNDYQKIEYIHFAIQEALQMMSPNEYNPELLTALYYVEDLREKLQNNDSYCKRN